MSLFASFNYSRESCPALKHHAQFFCEFPRFINKQVLNVSMQRVDEKKRIKTKSNIIMQFLILNEIIILVYKVYIYYR